MNKNRRNPQAGALRAFFEEQWGQLKQMLENYQAQNLGKEQRNQNISSAIETLVDGTDTRMRGIGNYHKKLRCSARELIDLIEQLVGKLPAPLLVNKATLVQDPLVHALFSSTERVQQLFSNNADVQAFFKAGEHQQVDEVFALLCVTREEKNVLGSEVRDNMVLNEVLQTQVNFTGHQIIEPVASEDESRGALQRMLFESVVKHLKIQITRLRHDLSAEQKQSVANNPDSNINNPAVYMDMLSEQLCPPTEMLKIQNNQLRISRMGIKLPLESTLSSDILQLYEVEIGDNQSRVVAMVRFPRNELRKPVNPFN